MIRLWSRVSLIRPNYSARYIKTNNPPIGTDNSESNELKELNHMYINMFTQNSTEDSVDSTHLSDLEELNKEINELYSIPVLTPDQLASKVASRGKFIIRSVSTDPFFNLALEDFIFKHTPIHKSSQSITDSSTFQHERLLFYVNDKCVVIGKNQNPWKELYLYNLVNRQYEFVRRKSGGGAVVHDLGNVNYSFITSREKFDRAFFNQNIVKWLTHYTKDIGMNARGDITLSGKKVSGSAFKIARGKGYHHGTMLVSSELSEFSGLLKPKSIDGIKWECNSVDSVRSPVENLEGKGIDNVDQFCDVLTNGFRCLMQEDVPLYYCDETSSTTEIHDVIEELKSFKWRYMTGPKFKVHIGNSVIHVDKGLITKSDIPETAGMTFNDFVHNLNDKLYKDYTAYDI
ncbi:putative lipoate--protein ligase Ecym_2328 [Eremothecium cymbalariae DBVPG|uniref:Putative lipoate-protein ligase A n=1 Tax=Eremothecium cymbalariae (strain CBS 270.75 / DBVPG 7215 / KCTC 17166 / NRRL Y-17582) TaxID=931890 RepID=G8JQ65_ERECY|nr:Hypothetical protein Ecym_2328 [Eremothecium cymbalariae DBVPG\